MAQGDAFSAWKRVRNLQQTAEYVELCPDVWMKLVRAGEAPAPLRWSDKIEVRKLAWDVRVLDLWLDARSGLATAHSAPAAATKTAIMEAIRGAR
jgi:hypothetical protein